MNKPKIFCYNEKNNLSEANDMKNDKKFIDKFASLTRKFCYGYLRGESEDTAYAFKENSSAKSVNPCLTKVDFIANIYYG